MRYHLFVDRGNPPERTLVLETDEELAVIQRALLESNQSDTFTVFYVDRTARKTEVYVSKGEKDES